MRASSPRPFSLLLVLVAALLISGGLLGACDSPADDEPPEAVETDEPTEEDTPDETLIASGGAVHLSLEDVEAAVHRMRLIAPRDSQGRLPEGDPEWMSSPQAQIALVRNLVHFQIVRHGAAERGITVTRDDVVAFIGEHDELRQYLPLFAVDADENELAISLTEELESLDLSIDDVTHLAEDMIYGEKLRDHLAEEFTDDQLWAIYQTARDEADLLVLQLHNTPTSEEIDQAMDRFDAEIRALYRDERERFRRPAIVRATLLTAPPEMARQQATEALAEAARRLPTDPPEEIANDLGLIPRVDRRIRPADSPEAFAAAPGESGVSLEASGGSSAWLVVDRTDEGIRPLDRSLRRELASEMLRSQGITPSNLEQAQRLRAILTDDLRGRPLQESEIDSLKDRLAQETDAAIHHTELFSVRASAVVPGLGLAEDLMEVVKELDFDDPVTEPVLDRNRIFVARLVDRRFPDRDTYEEEREEFRETFVERNRSLLVDQFVTRYQQEEGVSIQLGPLGDRYGTIAKKDAEPPPPAQLPE